MPKPDPFRSTFKGEAPPPAIGMHGVRRPSDYEYLGMPLWSIVTGPDPARGELRGHAKECSRSGSSQSAALPVA